MDSVNVMNSQQASVETCKSQTTVKKGIQSELL